MTARLLSACLPVATAALLLGLVSPVPTSVAESASAHAESATAEADLDLRDFADLVTDPGRRQLYLSQGGSRPVVVVDPDGRMTGTLPDSAGATGMALSSDASTLYLALNRQGRIAAVDLDALTTTSWRVPGCPDSVSETEAIIVYSDRCAGAGGSVDVLATDEEGQASTYLLSASEPELQTTPELPGVLFLAHTNTSRPSLSRYSVQRVEGSVTAERTATFDTQYSARFAFLPGAQRLVTGLGVVLDSTTLTAIGRRYSRPSRYTHGVAVRSDGLTAFSTSQERPSVVYPLGERRSVLNSYDFSDLESLHVPDNGIAFLGSRLYLVTHAGEYYDKSEILLRVITPRRRAAVRLSTPKATRCKPVKRVKIRLTGPATTRTVEVSARERRGGWAPVGTYRLNKQKRVTLKVKLNRPVILQALVRDQGARIAGSLKLKPRC